MGTELEIAHGFFDPARRVATTPSVVIAGEYVAVGVDSGNINPNLLTKTKAQLDQAKAELEAIKTQLDNNEEPNVSAFLTKHTLTGNLLQTGILGYFTINDALDQMDARSIKVVTQRLPSFGTFSTNLQPDYLFGVPRSVKLAGLSMDVDRISTLAASKADNRNDSIAFFRTTGPRKSAIEHLVPEQLFSTPEAPAQAVSAVKALAIAAQQGQKIYTLTSANAAQLNSLTISGAAKQEIASALNANKEVTVHQNPITYAGWTGEGYTVIDPMTGAGAYKITSGMSGGFSAGDSSTNLRYISRFTGIFGIVDGAEGPNGGDVLGPVAEIIEHMIESEVGKTIASVIGKALQALDIGETLYNIHEKCSDNPKGGLVIAASYLFMVFCTAMMAAMALVDLASSPALAALAFLSISVAGGMIANWVVDGMTLICKPIG